VQSKEEVSQKARAYAFLLLKFRLRSEQELYSRLKRKKFPEQVIDSTLKFLKEKNFIDDRVFASAWTRARLKRPFGIRRITQELALKGVPKDIVQDTLLGIKDNYSETQIVQNLAKEKLEKLKGYEPIKARNRVNAYLLRRGFSPETVYDVLSKLCKQTY